MEDRKGFSLLELMVAVSIAATVGVLGFALLASASQFGGQSARNAVLEDSARRAMDEMTGELRQAGSVTLTADVSFRKVLGFSARRKRWSVPITYRLSGGTLWRIEGASRSALVHSVRRFRAVREGRALRLELELGTGGERALLISTLLPRN